MKNAKRRLDDVSAQGCRDLAAQLRSARVVVAVLEDQPDLRCALPVSQRGRRWSTIMHYVSRVLNWKVEYSS